MTTPGPLDEPPVGAAKILPYQMSSELIPLMEVFALEDPGTLKKAFEQSRQKFPELELFKYWPILIEVMVRNRLDLVAYLLDQNVPFGELHIEHALKIGSTPMFELFVQHGWDVNELLQQMEPPPLSFVIEDWDATIWLLDHGADPNKRCYLDQTALSFAVGRSSLPIINLLFSRGGDIEKGQLIHHAIQRKTETIEVLEMLFEKGASINSTFYGNDLQSWSMTFFMGLGTVLHEAANRGRADLVTYLLEKGIDATIVDSKGRTALDCALEHEHGEVVEILRSKSHID